MTTTTTTLTGPRPPILTSYCRREHRVVAHQKDCLGCVYTMHTFISGHHHRDSYRRRKSNMLSWLRVCSFIWAKLYCVPSRSYHPSHFYRLLLSSSVLAIHTHCLKYITSTGGHSGSIAPHLQAKFERYGPQMGE